MDTATEQDTGIDAQANGGAPDDPEAERKSLAELAADEPDAEVEAEQFTLFGTAPRLSGSAGVQKVNSSHCKFKAAQKDLPGQFQMGDVIELRVLVRVDKLEFVQKHDGDGNVVATKRVHTLTALTVDQMQGVPEEFAEVDGRPEAMTDGSPGALD